MADIIAPVVTSAPQSSSPAKKPTKGAAGRKPKGSSGGAKKAKQPTNHPQYVDMITKAVQALKEHKGSSRQALLKYIMANFNVGNDAKVVNSRIKVALRRGVTVGLFKQAKGSGAAGSFRLGEKKVGAVKKAAAVKPKKVTAPAAPGTVAATKAKKAGRKSKSPKKLAAKKAVTAAVHVSPAKAKKAVKPTATKAAQKTTTAPVAAKPKAPKKATTTVVAAAPKKMTSPKKAKSPKKSKAAKGAKKAAAKKIATQAAPAAPAQA